MRNVIILLMTTLAFTACGDGSSPPPTGSSSSSSSSSSSTSSSSSSTSSSGNTSPVGNIANGENLFTHAASYACKGCHATVGVGLFRQPAGPNGETLPNLNVNHFVYPSMAKYDQYSADSVEDLANFIENEMIGRSMGRSSPQCGDHCALDLAAYLWSLRGQSTPVSHTVTGGTAYINADEIVDEAGNIVAPTGSNRPIQRSFRALPSPDEAGPKLK